MWVALFFSVSRADDIEVETPACVREGAKFWEGKYVIQVYGYVFAREDEDNVARKYYWKLGDAAIGKVVEGLDGGQFVVEFKDDNGWEKVEVPQEFQQRKVTTIHYDYDNYGRVQGASMTTCTREGFQVGPRQWGRIIGEEGASRTVRFPWECLGLPRPKVGDKVVRGPDWRCGHADGGSKPAGQLPSGEADLWGEVIKKSDEDRYVFVRWDKTGRESAYRYDYRRFYDVMVVPSDEK
jgi:hypothetical protein